MSTETILRQARQDEPLHEPAPTGGAGGSQRSATSMRRGFTPARVVALSVIAAVVFGLAYFRFAPGATPVAVPLGAKAGDLTLQPCRYATEQGRFAADCGTLVVPENRTNPQSRLIALSVTRLRARSGNAAEPIFVLQGGPGMTNLKFRQASRYADERDVVLVGYRGIDSSVRLNCPEVESALVHSRDFLGEPSLRAYGDGFRSCAERLAAGGVDLAGYSLAQRVDDLEAARRALGYGQIDLLSESAGTRTAMIYSWRYPNSIKRSVMIGVNPPGNFLMDGQTTGEQIGRYARLCAQDDGCRKRTDDLAASIMRTAAHMPARWLFLPIKPGNVLVATYFGFGDSRAEGGLESAPATLDTWLSAAEGDASGFWFSSLLADVMLPKLFVWGEYAATAVQDVPWVATYYAAGGDPPGSTLARSAMDYAWGGGQMGEAWPASPDDALYNRVQTSTVETLLVGGELDLATPPQIATKQLLPSLPNGQQVVLAGFGHLPTFWPEQPAASSRLINTFFASGQLDTSLYKPVIVNFTPEVTNTLMAKRIAGAMIGLAVLAVLSLVWMGLHVHRRGRFGRKTSALLRSVYPVALGLGGWFLGGLIAMTALPGVHLDDERLVALSVGVSIALGIFFAWVHVDWSAKTRITGFAAAAGGALIGAGPGFNASGGLPAPMNGLVAPLTAIVGAALGANLALLALDIWWGWKEPRMIPVAGATGLEEEMAATAGVDAITGVGEQYSLAKILGIWALAAVPMGILGWMVFPALSPDVHADPLGAGVTRVALFTVGLVWQFVLCLVIVRQEAGDLRWATIKRRLRLNAPRDPTTGELRSRLWLWAIPLILAIGVWELALGSHANKLWLSVFPFLAEPPGYSFSAVFQSPEVLARLVGAWWFFGLFVLYSVFNTVLGEEFLFRGVLLPKMEGVFGRWSWVANGVLFGCYHVHQPWGILSNVVSGVFLVAWPSWRFRTTWLGVIVHSVQSVFFAFLVLGVVLGLAKA